MRVEDRVNKLEKIKVNEKVRMCKKRKMEKVRISKGRGQTGVAIGYPIVISTDASAGGTACGGTVAPFSLAASGASGFWFRGSYV